MSGYKAHTEVKYTSKFEQAERGVKIQQTADITTGTEEQEGLSNIKPL